MGLNTEGNLTQMRLFLTICSQATVILDDEKLVYIPFSSAITIIRCSFTYQLELFQIMHVLRHLMTNIIHCPAGSCGHFYGLCHVFTCADLWCQKNFIQS